MRDNINGIKPKRFIQKIRDFFNPEQTRKRAEADIINDKFVEDMNGILAEVSMGINLDKHLETIDKAQVRIAQDRIIHEGSIAHQRTIDVFENTVLHAKVFILEHKYGYISRL